MQNMYLKTQGIWHKDPFICNFWHLRSVNSDLSPTRWEKSRRKGNWKHWINFYLLFLITYLSGFGGLEVACWPLVPKFAGSNPAKAVGLFRVKKILNTPSFGREAKPFSHVVDLRHVKDPWMLRGSRTFSGKIHAPFLAQVVHLFTTRVSGGSTWRCK